MLYFDWGDTFLCKYKSRCRTELEEQAYDLIVDGMRAHNRDIPNLIQTFTTYLEFIKRRRDNKQSVKREDCLLSAITIFALIKLKIVPEYQVCIELSRRKRRTGRNRDTSQTKA